MGDAKWVPAENLHATVSFLGRIDDERVDAIHAAVSSATASHPAVPTALTTLGAFPRERRARVVWAGLADDDGALATLAGGVIDALDAVGFPKEKRPWHPHVTIARLRQPRAVTLEAEVEAVAWTVDRLVLTESFLRRPAPRYEERASFRLA